MSLPRFQWRLGLYYALAYFVGVSGVILNAIRLSGVQAGGIWGLGAWVLLMPWSAWLEGRRLARIQGLLLKLSVRDGVVTFIVTETCALLNAIAILIVGSLVIWSFHGRRKDGSDQCG